MRVNIRNPVWSVVVGTALVALSLRQSRWRKQAAATGGGLIVRGIAGALKREFGQMKAAFARASKDVPS